MKSFSMVRAFLIALVFMIGHWAGQLQVVCPQPEYPELSWVQFEHIQRDCRQSARSETARNACIVAGVRKFFAAPAK